jgi:hypothetical protein
MRNTKPRPARRPRCEKPAAPEIGRVYKPDEPRPAAPAGWSYTWTRTADKKLGLTLVDAPPLPERPRGTPAFERARAASLRLLEAKKIGERRRQIQRDARRLGIGRSLQHAMARYSPRRPACPSGRPRARRVRATRAGPSDDPGSGEPPPPRIGRSLSYPRRTS